jgi:uncharacterized protein YbjT (DUF2867 family)
MSNASERILVAGAGVAGGEVLRQLAAAIRTACALVRNPQRAAPFRKLGVKLIEGDFANKESWQRALDGVAPSSISRWRTGTQLLGTLRFWIAPSKAR